MNLLHGWAAWGGLVLLAGLEACSGECVLPPCGPPVAVYLTVTSSASGDPIDDANVQVTGVATSRPCPGRCDVYGGPGTYQLTVSAPGFDPVERTITVSPGEPVPCGCGGVVSTEQVAVALTPAAP